LGKVTIDILLAQVEVQTTGKAGQGAWSGTGLMPNAI